MLFTAMQAAFIENSGKLIVISKFPEKLFIRCLRKLINLMNDQNFSEPKTIKRNNDLMPRIAV